MEYKTSPLKAIREKCLDCCFGSITEIKECGAVKCPLYPYRLGKNPFRQKREMTEEQKDALRERMKRARESGNKGTESEQNNE